jgi:hypothetical protein
VATNRVVATIGLHASASTWVFNVVRELLIAAFGDGEVTALYAETLGELPTEPTLSNRRLLIKSHHGSVELDAWLTANGAQRFLSVRDPRDASISMAQRFKAPLNAAVRWLENDCKRIIQLSAAEALLRYEDRFFENKSTVEQLAMKLGITVDPTAIETIFGRYDTEAVRAFSKTLRSLPSDRLSPLGALVMDRVTQIHEPHIGDTQSGKWRQLPPQVQSELTQRFGPFLEQFGYV